MSATRPDANGKPLKVGDSVMLRHDMNHEMLCGMTGEITSINMHGRALVQFGSLVSYFKGYELVLVEGEA